MDNDSYGVIYHDYHLQSYLKNTNQVLYKNCPSTKGWQYPVRVRPS